MKPVTASGVHDQNVSRYRPLQNKGPVMKSWTRGAAWVLAVWSCSRVLLTMVGVLVRQWTGHHNDFGLDPGYQWLDIWGEWDTGWYLNVAESGYSAARSADGLAGGYANYAFFPLYPWLTRITADLVGIPTYIAGLVVSNVAILLGAVVLYRLLELERSTATARRGVLFLFLFPTSYVLSCMMTESLFCPLQSLPGTLPAGASGLFPVHSQASAP